MGGSNFEYEFEDVLGRKKSFAVGLLRMISRDTEIAAAARNR